MGRFFPKTLLVWLVVFLAGMSMLKAQPTKQEAYKKYKSRASSTQGGEFTELIQGAALVKEKNPAGALDLLKEALALAVASNNEGQQAQCYQLLGDINTQIKEWNLAKANYERAYAVLWSGKTTSTDNLQKLLTGLGNACLELGQYQEAIQYYDAGIGLSAGKKKNEFQLLKSEALYRSGNYEESKKASDDVEQGGAELGNSLQTQLTNQRAKIASRALSDKPAANIYEQPLNQLRSGGTLEPQATQSLQNTKEEISETLRERQDYDAEIDLRKNSIAFNLENKNLEEVTKDKVAISESLNAKGETDAAMKEVEEAAILADKLPESDAQATAYLSLANAYEKRGRTERALEAYKKFSFSIQQAYKKRESEFSLRDSIIQKQKSIEELASTISMGMQEDNLQRAVVNRQQLVIYGLALLTLVVGTTSVITFRNARAKQMANQLLALKSLRSQMNPHFIFNALNSVNHFIAKEDERTANKFLSEFSLLMRLVLENSEKDFITLATELEMLTLYLKLEHYRFRDKFEYEFKVGDSIAPETVELPPMLIQPYIENAVWHGLRYKETSGKLLVQMEQIGSEILVTIEDNGIGRHKSAALKTVNQKKHQSTGLKNIRERLGLLNRVYKSNYAVEITDLPGDSGTRVNIHLPLHRPV